MLTKPVAKYVAILLLSLICSDVIAAPLKFCYEDTPQKPWTNPDGTGLNIVLLQQVEKRLGEQFIYVSQPWKACQEAVRAGEFDGFFSAAPSKNRREYSVFPSLADGSPDPQAILYEEAFSVYLRQGGSGSWDGKVLRSPRNVIVQSGYVVGAMVREQGLEIDDSSKSAEDGLNLLLQNKADVAILQGAGTETLARVDQRFKDRVEKAPAPFVVVPLYLAINKNTFARDPKRIEAIWRTIHVVRQSPDYLKGLEDANVR